MTQMPLCSKFHARLFPRLAGIALVMSVLTVLVSSAIAQPGGGGRGPGGGRGGWGGGRRGGNFDWGQFMQRVQGGMQVTQAPPAPAADPNKAEAPKVEGAPATPPVDEGPAPVKRPDFPREPADPKELEAKPGDDGKISFSFKGQTWPDVLEWLADISDMSLQWEEAPAGYVDLTTRGEYTVSEVRDMLNSVLLSKGFSLLRNGEVMIVANLKKLDTSLVPRLPVKELENRGPHELVKVFFDLDWLIAEKAAEELKPLMSPFGKLTALKSTNRLDALDTVENLLRLGELIGEEQSTSGQQRLVREFKLKYTRAREALETLNLLLGIESKDGGQGRSQQEAMMLMAQQGQQPGQQPGVPAPAQPSVFLAVNPRDNSILANAPPDKMGVIEQAILAIDVPQTRDSSRMGGVGRMQVYRLTGIAPETLVKVLDDLGGLDPTTKIEVDSKNKALVVYAPLVDHVVIRSLVEKLDGAGRRFEVYPLRTLQAEYVAGTIMTLMNGPDKNESRNRNPWMWDFGGGNQQTETTDKFWVEADIEGNKLLMRANDVELAEVRALLTKLGEPPADERNPSTVRMVPFAPGEDSEKFLERLERLWPSISPNPLEIESIDGEPSANSGRDSASPRRSTRKRSTRPTKDKGDSEKSNPPRDRKAESKPRRDRAALGSLGRFRFAQVTSEKDADHDVSETTQGADVVESDSKTDASEPSENSSDAPAEAESSESQPLAEEDSAEASADEGSSEGMASEDEMGGDEASFEENGMPDPRESRAPVKITVGPNGIVVSCTDPAVLDRMEQLMNDIMPSKMNHKLFTLQHTYAKDVVVLLRDIFREADQNSQRNNTLNMIFGNGSTQQPRASLSKKRPLSFVADAVTNTILVQGADSGQLAEIESLLEIYDQAETPNSESVRRTKRITLKYAKAKDVSETVKDVFRDLLSPNDKSLVGNGGQPQGGQQQGGRRGGFGDMMSFFSDSSGGDSLPRFKGLLSIGIDERGNSLIVSAPQVLLTGVIAMAEDLDNSARPSRPVVKLFKVKGSGAAARIRQAFSAPKTTAGGKNANSDSNSNSSGANSDSNRPGGAGTSGSGSGRNGGSSGSSGGSGSAPR